MKIDSSLAENENRLMLPAMAWLPQAE